MTRLQERDKEILKAVHDFGTLTTAQISKLMDIHLKVCQRRLRKLTKADYLRTVLIPTTKAGRSPYLFYLGEQAQMLLNVQASKPKLGWKLSHQIKNTDLVLHIALSSRNTGFECHLLPEHLIRSASQEVIPDGAFMLRSKGNGKSALFIVENCAGTEIISSPSYHEDVESKLIRYAEMFEQDDLKFYEEHFQSEFARFRLLFVVNNYQRFHAISDVVTAHDQHGFIWLTTFAQFMKLGVLGKLWSVPSRKESNLSIV